MHRLNILSIILISVCFSLSLLIFRDKFDNLNEINESNVVSYRNFENDAPEQKVFEYVRLVKDNNFEELDKLYTIVPKTYLQKAKEDYKDRTDSLTQMDEKNGKSEISSDSPTNFVLNHMYHDFFIKYAPKFINSKNLSIERTSRIEVSEEMCRIRVYYVAGDKPSADKHDFFLYKKDDIWKIFKIDFP